MTIKNIIERNVIEINNNRITKVGYYAFFSCSNLTKVNLPAAINVDRSAFNICYSLTTVNLPAATYIGDNAFNCCYNLTSISLPAATNIGTYAFNNCSSLTSIDLPAVTSIGYCAFENCSSLTTINLPTATNIGNDVFNNCSNLTSVNLPAAIDIGEGAFVWCSSLTSIDLPKVINIGYNAFYYCSSLTSVNLPAATSIGYSTFYNCSSLTSINLPKATNIGFNAFYNCCNLTSVNLPAATSIGNGAFSNCYNLTSVNLPVAISIGNYAFSCCSKLMDIRINSDSLCIGGSSMFYSTPIDKTYSINKEYGKIWVCPYLVEQYKTASYWSTYADRIFPLGTLIIFTGATENNKYYQNGKERPEIYGYGLTEFNIYNKIWGKLSVSIDNVEQSETPLEYNIVAPTDYKTITVKNTSDQNFDSYTVGYDDISFICTSFPDTIGIPLNTKINIDALNSSYQVKIVNLEITNNTTIDLANYLEELPYINVNITADNAAQYTTLVDGSNFEISSGKIQNGSKSHNVSNGFSLGYIEIDTPDFESDLSITYSVSCEDGYDYGIVLLSTIEQSITSSIRTTIPSGCTRLFRKSGTISSTTYTTTLEANTHYYVYFVYSKDKSGNSGSDRFFIEKISFTQVK